MFDDPGIASSPLALSADRCVELFSFAKSHQMGGFRLGFALGNAQVLASLEAVKVGLKHQGLAVGCVFDQGPLDWPNQ